ncbi:hypothetical protein HOD19_02805 [bacterium]|jgi:hypothetical protein|nr:hypothetical protein [bacterium]
MKYFLSGMFLALFVAGGAFGIFTTQVKASSIPEETRPCTWSEIKDCYSGGHNQCCPDTKGDG